MTRQHGTKGSDHAEGDRESDSVTKEKEEQNDERRTVDESVPTVEGFTSPGKGEDDAPVEPKQSKDYA